MRWLLILLCVLGVAAQLIKPLGDALANTSYLGGSFAAFISLILFDAITSSDRPREVFGVVVLEDVDDLADRIRESFGSKHIKLDFLGFAMETLVREIRPSMAELARQPRGARSLTLRVLLPYLGSPMNLPSGIHVERREGGNGAEILVFQDSPENRERMRLYSQRYRDELEALIEGITERQPHVRVDWEIRYSGLSPQFKLVNLNDEEYFYSYYEIVEGKFRDHNGDEHQILDPHAFGLPVDGAKMIGWSRRSRSDSTRKVADYHSAYYESVWSIYGRVQPPTMSS